MQNESANSSVLTMDNIPGQDGLTDYEIGVLKEIGLNPNELNAKDLEIIKLKLPQNADLLKKAKSLVELTEGEIEHLLEDDKTDRPKKHTDTQSREKPRKEIVDDPDDDDDGPDDGPPVLLDKPAGIVYHGEAELPTKAEKTPEMVMGNETNNETESSSTNEKKPEGWADSRSRYGAALRGDGEAVKWVDIAFDRNEERSRKPKAAAL